MKKTLIKYPPQAQEVCEYEVISAKGWNFDNRAQLRETMQPFAGPYYDGEGWMLNAALADVQGRNVVLVEEPDRNGRFGITIYRPKSELLPVDE